MTKQIKWLILTIVILVLALLINNFNQRKTISRSEILFSINDGEVTSFEIIDSGESIKLVKQFDSWTILEHDSLIVKQHILDNFLNIIKNAKRGSLISENTNNWDKYGVGESTGKWVIVSTLGKSTQDTIIVGRSSSNWSINNIRIPGSNNVYQLNSNIMYNLNIKPSHWGEMPTTTDTIEQ